jgi:hypothetical protein
MKKFLSLIIILFTTIGSLTAQVAINPSGTAPHPSAMLDVSSTNKGFLPPRLTTAQRIALPTITPANGLIVFDTDTQSLWIIQSGIWVNYGAIATGFFQSIAATQDIKNSNTGNVGIGLMAPAAKLDVYTPKIGQLAFKANGDGGARTQALFGNVGNGISLQKDPAAIGFNQYFDNFGSSRFMNIGYGFIQELGSTGRFTWKTTGSGNAEDLATAKTVMELSQDGTLGINSLPYNDAKLIVNADAGKLTNAIFGYDGQGISLQKNWPTIGFNTYRDDLNVQRNMGGGYGFGMAINPTTGMLFFNRMGTGAAYDAIGANEQFVMGISQSGNLGIGTTNPINKIQIGNPPAFAGNDIAIGNGSQGMSLYQSPTSSIFYTNTNFAFMPFSSSGNVGIGVLNPVNKLEVNGVIRSKELIVETGWADYVFEDNYKLPSLETVEKHIKINKHLPNIPSANTIQNQGLSVGAVQTKMMEKIEELTLYIIEQNKRIKELEVLMTKSNK